MTNYKKLEVEVLASYIEDPGNPCLACRAQSQNFIPDGAAFQMLLDYLVYKRRSEFIEHKAERWKSCGPDHRAEIAAALLRSDS